MRKGKMRDEFVQKALEPDSVILTDSEKTIFRCVIFGSLFAALVCGLIGFATMSSAWMTGSMFLVLIAAIFALFWYFQAYMHSLRDYGLGEGVANLYGEERAKMMFGESYRRPEPRDD